MTFLRDSFCVSVISLSRQGHDILDFSCWPLTCHAFCMWLWSIGEDLDLSFIWGHHHLHLEGIDYQSISCGLLHYLLHRADETQQQQGRNSCPRLRFLVFSFDSSHVVSLLSFLLSISLASLAPVSQFRLWNCVMRAYWGTTSCEANLRFAVSAAAPDIWTQMQVVGLVGPAILLALLASFLTRMAALPLFSPCDTCWFHRFLSSAMASHSLVSILHPCKLPWSVAGSAFPQW